ncbi:MULTISPECIES: Crp/Fnr family transcriptional regulator [Chryseobacterium]|uniref:CRP-like cAMP-binding protein n=1 Tax=Chryseobacterium camelliae TaxID=1265445 RepID=A0ABU0TLW6_9FLAO|nr:MULTISPECIES: Crp/Fnr family transcriptional regulator [Chryseobacterium]MDT3408893.1 CRP-like cAMP-binding protein [Pseudacidovorax intermedius]MDQ1097250.1 CRP-like cAMP-binding protein [Chryseobacterium camelliae]MDQ1101185.1 CRP-like cAMP-binding protein [Chryseobacterium sp. SORGH_AS_1048]MDR6084630.1 CRP-like cAMP-binding protein [Chryseobacterium sp. SORGH_AS_0909]MDR6132902.1 CRP-like cAMP-binding protein [Chryseobacterium sp. SORGH_AS_1175]
METLKQHLKHFISLSEEDYTSVFSFFRVMEVGKKRDIMKQGELCKSLYFVEKGCIRKFFVNDKGVEQTTEFALEHWWMSDTFAYERQQKTDFTIQAVEPSVILVLDYEQQKLLIAQHPAMEHYFRMVYQRACAAAERRIRYLYEYSREEMYIHFSTQYPGFVQRVPQYLIASFLGFTPEYLSEIRAKLRS